MTDELRFADSVARFGGDEFVVSLSNIRDREAASLVAQKLINRLRQPYQLQGNEIEIGISVGICIYPDNGDSIDSLIHSADSAMYQAKQNGGNSSCVFDAARLDKS
ncbi:GGDEF domain-containing protein [Candidatus Reidiella endopervernicosa]|uniref:GGDEF domain-containing protein n=1 Tax=Candidatus Reidiella endopervernicosa TaxID=2738883 RepID=A0A6N0HS63_9GAMM|nr:GGDEF domain-containing protein [Candidatus Reidiella endopervernicosa]